MFETEKEQEGKKNVKYQASCIYSPIHDAWIFKHYSRELDIKVGTFSKMDLSFMIFNTKSSKRMV